MSHVGVCHDSLSVYAGRSTGLRDELNVPMCERKSSDRGEMTVRLVLVTAGEDLEGWGGWGGWVGGT